MSAPLHELLVDEITSVGLVPRGDNPAAKVAFWKAKGIDSDDDAGRAERLAGRLYSMAKTLHDGEATTFTEELSGDTMAEVMNEVWTVTAALNRAVTNTLDDQDEPDRESLIKGSLDQFVATVLAALPEWLEGQPTGQFEKTIEDPGKDSGETSGKNPTYPDGSDTVGKQDPADDAGKDASSREGHMPDTAPTLSDEVREGLTDEAVEYLKHLEETVAGIDAVVTTAVEKALADSTKSDDGEGEKEDIRKGLSDEQAAAFDKMQEDLDAAKDQGDTAVERIAKMERDREVDRFTEIAKGFPGLGAEDDKGEPTDIDVQTIEAVEKIEDEDVRENVYKALRAREVLATAATIVKSSPRRLIGGDGTDSEQADAIVIAKAAELRTADSDLTEEQAYDRALDEVDPKVAAAAVAAPAHREGS